jgi:hypothetical protein
VSLLERERAALVVVDVQEGFRSSESFGAVSAACGRLVEGARILGVPVIATAQYPKGLGPVAPEVGLDAEPVEKTVFSTGCSSSPRPTSGTIGPRPFGYWAVAITGTPRMRAPSTRRPHAAASASKVS